MKDREREREVDNTARDRIHTAMAFVVVTMVTILVGVVAALAILKYDFEKAETEFFEGFDFSFSPELWERVPDLYIYPWSEYRKYSTRECMVDMVNYDGMLISDRESAVTMLYEEARKLLTEDDKEYYVWNEIQAEGVYLFGMVNMNGEIFSFHYVTDMEWEGDEAIQYVEDSFKDDDNYYPLDYQFSDFSNNRTLFIKNII